MAKKASPKIKINLSSTGKQTVGKVVYGWTIDAGRAIIVGIELIALAALGYRFVIDRQIVDLHDQIKTQEVYIAAQSADEKVYRSVQDRLKNIKDTTDATSEKIQIMNEIIKAVTSGTFFSTNISINANSLFIEGSTFSVVTLTDFLNSLKNFPSVAGISIDELNTANDGIRFKTRIDIKNLAQAQQKTPSK